MKILHIPATFFLVATLIAASAFAQTPAASPPSVNTPITNSAAPSESEMMKQMMEMAKLNDNHKLLASLNGTWSYTVKMWMNGDPTTKPEISKGTATRKSIMDERFVVMNVSGKMDMAGLDGKMNKVTFTGQGTEGYDNVKKKFVGTWMDNMGTGIMMSEGDYDPATKAFTYTGQYEMLPGMTQKIREVMKLADNNHMTFEWYEDRGGKEAKTMEINYTRAK